MVYLLHFDAPLGSERHQARHYIGYTQSGRTLPARLETHSKGNGARIMEVLAERGITFRLARTWAGKKANRHFERRLKRAHHHARLCPVCNPDTAGKHMSKKKGKTR